MKFPERSFPKRDSLSIVSRSLLILLTSCTYPRLRFSSAKKFTTEIFFFYWQKTFYDNKICPIIPRISTTCANPMGICNLLLRFRLSTVPQGNLSASKAFPNPLKKKVAGIHAQSHACTHTQAPMNFSVLLLNNTIHLCNIVSTSIKVDNSYLYYH